jgi:hypothetical protein
MLSDPEHTQLRRTFTLWIKQLSIFSFRYEPEAGVI